jgi:hypothetical protein
LRGSIKTPVSILQTNRLLGGDTFLVTSPSLPKATSICAGNVDDGLLKDLRPAVVLRVAPSRVDTILDINFVRESNMALQHPPRFLKIVDDAKTRVRETTVEAVKKKIDKGEKFLLVDVRGSLAGRNPLGEGHHRA